MKEIIALAVIIGITGIAIAVLLWSAISEKKKIITITKKG